MCLGIVEIEIETRIYCFCIKSRTLLKAYFQEDKHTDTYFQGKEEKNI